ncbi:MAG: hypothetical protein Q4E57_01765 [Eubacteriales bacterium]|nr:hypothetical protein [Eubacteriales bacterium]
MKKQLILKLKNRGGETLVETLIATMVMVLAMTMLAGCIVSAARVTSRLKNNDTSFMLSDDTSTAKQETVIITFPSYVSGAAGSDTQSISETVYTTENGCHYYDHVSSSGGSGAATNIP